MNFKHASLFSGIGGFDLAAHWMGWENVFHCEINPFCQQLLKYYWPAAELFTDITKSNFKDYANKIDILTGGFPCQPYSAAGKRKGTDDERHLWPEMLRTIREIQPRWVVGENVHGLINWNGGMVFDEVQTDLEAAGFEVWPYVLPACSVNAPHRRDRIWFIAHSVNKPSPLPIFERGETSTKNIDINGNGKEQFNSNSKSFRPKARANDFNIEKRNTAANEQSGDKNIRSKLVRSRKNGIATNSDASRKRGQKWQSQSQSNIWEQFPTQSPLCNGNDGIPFKLDSLTISKKKWVMESLSGGGNAIVPQVVLQIFKAIEKYENEHGD